MVWDGNGVVRRDRAGKGEGLCCWDRDTAMRCVVGWWWDREGVAGRSGKWGMGG